MAFPCLATPTPPRPPETSPNQALGPLRRYSSEAIDLPTSVPSVRDRPERSTILVVSSAPNPWGHALYSLSRSWATVYAVGAPSDRLGVQRRSRRWTLVAVLGMSAIRRAPAGPVRIMLARQGPGRRRSPGMGRLSAVTAFAAPLPGCRWSPKSPGVGDVPAEPSREGQGAMVARRRDCLQRVSARRRRRLPTGPRRRRRRRILAGGSRPAAASTPTSGGDHGACGTRTGRADGWVYSRPCHAPGRDHGRSTATSPPRT
jgi:hypothetical protein